jgi:hypothetical protein
MFRVKKQNRSVNHLKDTELTPDQLVKRNELKLERERRNIIRLARLFVCDEEIAILAKKPVEYIRETYRNVIDGERLSSRLNILQAQINTALKGNAQMLMWLGKHLLGQKDTRDGSSFEPEFRLLAKALARWEHGTDKLIEATIITDQPPN